MLEFILFARSRFRLPIAVLFIYVLFGYFHLRNCRSVLGKCENPDSIYTGKTVISFIEIDFCFQYAIIVHLLGTCTAMFCVHNIYIYKHNEKMRRERDFFLASRRSYPSINPLSRLLICLGKTKHKRLLYRNLKDTTKKEESLLNYHTRKYLMFGDCVGRVENLKLQSVSLQGILEFLKQNSSRCCLLPKLWNRLPGPLILAILNRVWSLIESTFAKFFILDMSNYVSDIEDERFWENSRTKNYEEILRNGGVVTRLRTDDETMDKIFNKYLQEMINLTNYRQRMAYDLSKNIFGILLPSGVAVTIEGQTVTQEQISEGFIQRKLGYLKRGIYSVLGYSSSLEYHQIADDDGSKPEHVNMSDDMLRFIMSSIEHEAMKERKEGIPLTSGLSVLFVPTLSHVIRLIFDFVFNISAIMPSGCKRTEVGVCITTTTTAIFLAVASWELYLLNLVKRNKERAERNNEDSLSRIDHYLDLYRKCQRDTDI